MNKAIDTYNSSVNPETNTIILSGYISAWQDEENLIKLAQNVQSLEGDTVELIINSGGGSVFEGMAMAGFIKNSGKKVNTHIMGFAGSIASILAISGDTTSITNGSMFMIHKATLGTWGESGDLRKDADFLEKIDNMLANFYTKTITDNGKTIGGSTQATRAQVVEWMAEETYFTAEEAVKYGFIQKYVEKSDSKEERAAAAIGGKILARMEAPKEVINKYQKNSKMAVEQSLWAKLTNFMGGSNDTPPKEEPKPEAEPKPKAEAKPEDKEEQKKEQLLLNAFETLEKKSNEQQARISELENQLAELAAKPSHGGVTKEKKEDPLNAMYTDIANKLGIDSIFK